MAPLMAAIPAVVGSTAFQAIGLGLTVLQTVSGVMGAVQEGRNQKKISEYNVNVLNERAKGEEVAASIEAARERRRSRQVVAKMRAGMGEAGALSGSAFDVIDQAQVAAELDALTLKYNGDVNAQGLRSQAAVEGATGSAKAKASKSKAFGTFLSGVGNVMGGMSDIARKSDPLSLAT